MGYRSAISVFLLAAVSLLGRPAPASAQLVLGQYEEEAPVRTWNAFAPASAAALGRGETSMTFSLDAASATANPALLAGLPRFTLAVNGYLQSAGFNKFGPVNTGVILMRENAGLVSAVFGSAGLSVRLGGWTLGLNVFADELYDRPETSVQGTYNGTLYYEADYRQTGLLRTWQLAVARRVGARLSFGAAVNAIQGSLEREFIDTSYFPTIIISDRKTQTFSGFYVNGGVLAKIFENMQAALVFRTPYRKGIRSESNLRYEAPSAGTLITIADSADDQAEIPGSIGLGARLSLLPEFDVFCEATAFFWSGYTITFFGDPQVREFRDVVKAGLGLEYRAKTRLFGSEAVLPFRIGGVYDPQPARSPHSSYAGFTFGTGLQGKRLGLDIGGLVGRESGSGNGLGILKLTLSLRYAL